MGGPGNHPFSSITREQAERREAIMVTVNSTDVVGFVDRARAAVQAQVRLPAVAAWNSAGPTRTGNPAAGVWGRPG